MIVERTHYWAKPGRTDDVLAIRRKACAVRLEIGLMGGRIRVKADATSDGPDVAWECAFADRETHAADLAARAGSQAFERVRAEMRAAIERFERVIEAPAAGPAGWSRDELPAAIPLAPEVHGFTSAGRPVTGYLWRPAGAAGDVPCVVYCHGSGLGAPHEDNALPAVPALLASWGLACFFPHRAGYGLSPGPHWREECPGEPFSDAYNQAIVARLERECADVVAAVGFARTLSGIAPGRIALMGSSFGGVNTMLAAERLPDVRCAVNFAGAAMNWDRNPLIARRLIEAARRLAQPVLLAQAANDFSVRPTRELAAVLAEARKEYEAHIFPAFGATAMEGHFLAGRGVQVWGPVVRRFLERWL